MVFNNYIYIIERVRILASRDSNKEREDYMHFSNKIHQFIVTSEMIVMANVTANGKIIFFWRRRDHGINKLKWAKMQNSAIFWEV